MVMYVCTYCGTERHELRVCCGEVHSEECSEQAIALADKTGRSPIDTQDDFNVWLEKHLAIQDAEDKEKTE